MADDVDDDTEPQPERAHAYDANDLRVSCLPSAHLPFEELCSCGHLMRAASRDAVLTAMAEHLAWAKFASLHA